MWREREKKSDRSLMSGGTKARKKYSGKAVKANRELSPRSIAVTSSTGGGGGGGERKKRKE